MQSKWILTALATITLSLSCSWRSSDTPKKQDVQGNEPAVEASAAANTADATAKPDPGPKCPSGKAPQILSGKCTGSWRVTSKDGKSLCTFDWGPMVQCPQGTTALGYAAVCYGATEKTIEGKAQASTKDCADQFGALPLEPAYTLSCCSP